MTPPRPYTTKSLLAEAGRFATVVGLLWTLATYAAEHVAGPTRQELHYHLDEVSKSMAPGGAMHDRIARMDRRDEWIVETLGALCRAERNANCPAPTKLVQAP
jgi:hypothetical protein